MLKNYFKIALRNLLKNKSASVINISGLMIGFCSCLLISVYILHEFSYDDFQLKGNRIVRVIMGYRFNGGSEEKKGNFTSVRVAPVFKANFPEIENGVRMFERKRIVQYGEMLINEERFMYADSSFFKVFSFGLLTGKQNDALNGPNKVVLTKTTANKYFGDENAIGKTLLIGIEKKPYQVTGVMPDCPTNSQIKFDFLASFSSLGLTANERTYWDANYTTYLLLKTPSAINSLQAKIGPFMKKEMAGDGASINFYLEPFKSIHLHSEFDRF